MSHSFLVSMRALGSIFDRVDSDTARRIRNVGSRIVRSEMAPKWDLLRGAALNLAYGLKESTELRGECGKLCNECPSYESNGGECVGGTQVEGKSCCDGCADGKDCEGEKEEADYNVGDTSVSRHMNKDSDLPAVKRHSKRTTITHHPKSTANSKDPHEFFKKQAFPKPARKSVQRLARAKK
jgi:hypothetical protein